MCHHTRRTCTRATADKYTHQLRDVLQIVGFTHGCYRRACGGWSRWWRVLWRWPRCSDTGIAAEIKRGEEKKKKADNLTAAAIHFSRPRRWDVTDVYMMQKLKSNPDGFSRVWEGRGEGINSSREIKSTCRLISVTSESTQESPFIILAGFCPATCQIVSPAPRIHLVSEIHSAEPWSNCILCMSVRLCDVSTSDKTVKLWKISERDKRPEGYNLKDEDGRIRDPSTITTLRVCETVECHNTHDVTYTAVKIGCD